MRYLAAVKQWSVRQRAERENSVVMQRFSEAVGTSETVVSEVEFSEAVGSSEAMDRSKSEVSNVVGNSEKNIKETVSRY